jgi:hypothetical protein
MLRVAFSDFDDKKLKAEFDRAIKAKAIEAGDHQSAVLGTYAGLVKEILDERAGLRKAPEGTTTMPSLEQLKKKYLGK